MVGLGLVGATLTNKSPVTLEQVAPMARLTGEYQPLVVAADSPIKTLDDLIAKFKADPGSVSWGGFALGSPDHILSALIVQAAGGDVTKMNYIVAGAGGEMLAQVMGGHLTVATGGLNEMAQQIQAGKLRALGISSPERLPGVDIPTFKEQGLDVTLVNWRGLMAPAKMRPAEKKALDAALGEMVKSDGWQALLKERGWVDMYQPADEFAAFLGPERRGSRAFSRMSAWCSDGREGTMTTGSSLRSARRYWAAWCWRLGCSSPSRPRSSRWRRAMPRSARACSRS